jgi:hypothetical protein
MAALHDLLRVTHIAFGVVGLLAFWVPAFARKGQRLHVNAGRVFAWTGYVVIATAIFTAAIRLIWPLEIGRPPVNASAEAIARVVEQSRVFATFLLYLGIVTLAGLHHGLAVLRTHRAATPLRTPTHTLLNVVSIVASAIVVVLGLWFRQPILLALSPLGILGGIGALKYARRPAPSRMSWWYEHMGGMLGTGIAFHTAFLVFGARQLFGFNSDGLLAVVPWILPSAVGIPAIVIWTNHYRRKFAEVPEKLRQPRHSYHHQSP